MNRKRVWGPVSLLSIMILLALFPSVGAVFDVAAQTIPTITPTPDGSQPTATSAPSNPTATSPSNPPPSNPTATSVSNPTSTVSSLLPSATPGGADDATATSGPGTPSTTPERGTATATRTPRSTLTRRATATRDATSTADATDEARVSSSAEDTVTELATASPIPDRADEIEEAERDPADPLDEETGGGSLLWVLLLGAALIIAAGVLFVTGRRAS